MKKSIAIVMAFVMIISLLQMGMVSADEIPTPITVTSSVASGAMVVSTDKVTLTFSEAIDPDTLAAGITFSGGAITPVVKEGSDNKIVEITIPQVATIGNYNLTVGATVTGAEEDATFTYNVVNLLFDMDIAGTDGAAVDQVDATVNATAATQHNLSDNPEGGKWALSTRSSHATLAGAPIYHNDNGLEYLTFKDATDGRYTGGSQFSRVAVPMDPALDIANKAYLTFETWIRPSRAVDTENWGYWFAFGRTKFAPWNTLDDTTVGDVITNAIVQGAWRQTTASYSGLALFPDLKTDSTKTLEHGLAKDLAEGLNNPLATAKLGDMASFNNKWAHIVMTREYKNGNWESVLYVNGNRRTFSDNNRVFKAMTKTDHDSSLYNTLILGSGTRNNGDSFAGDISTFKLYDGVLDEATVRQKYYDSYQTYYGTGDDGISKLLEIKVEDGTIVSTSDDDAPGAKRLHANAGYKSGFQPTDPVVATEDGVSYMKFASVENTTLTDPVARLYYKLNDIEVADKDKITVTAWVRQPYLKAATGVSSPSITNRTTLFSFTGNPVQPRGSSPDSKNIFRLSYLPNGLSGEDAAHSKIVVHTDSASAGAAPKAELSDIKDYENKWTHYALTKTWVGTDGSRTTGKWQFKLYINKSLVSTQDIAVANRIDWSEKTGAASDPDSADYLVIGGMGTDTAGASFIGDIAHFTLYSGEFDEAQVASDYYATCAPFVEETVINLTMQGDVKLTADNLVEATEVNIDGVILKDIGENKPVVFLAVYGDEDSTKLIGVALADVIVADGQIKFNAKVDGLTQGTAKHVKVFVWDSFANMRPLIEAVSCL